METVGYVDVLLTHLGPASGVAFFVIAILSNCSMFNIYIAAGLGFFVMATTPLMLYLYISGGK